MYHISISVKNSQKVFFFTFCFHMKIYRLRLKDLTRVPSGHIIALITHDAQRLDQVFQKVGFVLQGLLELVTVTALIWRLIGFQAVSGIIFLILLLAYYVGMWDVCMKLRLRIARWTERRMGTIEHLVSGIRAIKMNTWEWPYKNRVEDIRR